MTELVALAVLASVALLVPATLAVLVSTPSRATARPGRLAVLAAVVALATVLGAALAGARPVTAVLVALAIGGSVLAWGPVGRHWTARGVLVWALTLDASLSYLLSVAHWTLTSGRPLPSMLAGSALWVLEVFVLVLAIGYVWEFVDVVARWEWPRRVRLPSTACAVQPFVSLHVPTRNEPPELVIATLESLLVLDYDAYEVLLVDDNTDDPALRRARRGLLRTARPGHLPAP